MQHFILRFLVRWAINSLGLWLAAALLGSGITYAGTGALIGAGFILALLNMLLKPLLVVLSLPALVLSLGLFMLVINGFLVYLVSRLYTPLHITNFWAAILAGLVIGIVNWLVSAATEGGIA